MVRMQELHRLFGPLDDAGCTAMSQADDALTALRHVNPDAAKRLEHMKTLEAGWYEEGSLPISPQAIDTAARVILVAHGLYGSRLKPPFPAPGQDGDVEIDWDGERVFQLMLMIPPEGSPVRFLLETPGAAGEFADWEGHIPGDGSLQELLACILIP